MMPAWCSCCCCWVSFCSDFPELPPSNDGSADGKATMFMLCKKIQKTSFVTLTASLHHTRYGLSRLISRIKLTGFFSSSVSGSRRNPRMVWARVIRSFGVAHSMYVSNIDVMILRVVNSLGPFFSGSKIKCNSAGNKVEWIV